MLPGRRDRLRPTLDGRRFAGFRSMPGSGAGPCAGRVTSPGWTPRSR